MKFNEEIEKLKILKYGLYISGIIIILGSINAIFDKNDSWSVQKKFYKRFYHTEYLFYLFITLFMILSPYLFFETIPNNINYQNLTDTKKIIYKLQRASIHGFIGYVISVFAYLGYTFIPFLITFVVSYYFL